MGKTVAITGVNSYFASTILPHLQADPEIEKIIGIDVTPWRGGFSKVDFHREDIRSEKIHEILKECDVLFHLAFVVGEIRDKEKTRDININGSKNIFQACVKHGIRKVIYTSSMTVYGSHKDNPVGFTEESPLARNDDNYYNTSKVEVESFVSAFFEGHPDITLTVIRAALLVGPKVNNMFSRLWSMKITALPTGNISHNQFIHEADLGRALYLAYQKDIPGIYNVTADDAVPTRWCFKQKGALILPLPTFLLKPVANLAFKLGLFPASGGWVSMSRFTIFGLSNKFKSATGWQPRYSSETAFLSYVEAQKKVKNTTWSKSLVGSLLKYPFTVKMALRGTDTGFKIGKIPGLRKIFPWTAPQKNSITYLPVNEHVEYKDEEILPQTIHNLIDKTDTLVIMNRCACRYGEKCENYPVDIGCLFMGESALAMPESVRRQVTREEAHAHVDRAVSAGLVPLTGKVRYDNDAFLIPDKSKLLSVCFCCHCCCMMRGYKYLPADQLNEVMPRVEGFQLEITDACIGCGECIPYCGWDAIYIENGRAVHTDKCRGCGRCARHCPQDAITITINNPNATADVEKRVLSYVSI